MPVFDHVREGFARLDLAAEVRNIGRTASSSLLSVTTMSRIGCALPATASQTPMASNRRRAAAAIAEARGSFGAEPAKRVGDRHRKSVAQPLAQRDGERQAGKAAARDNNVGPFGCWFVLHHRPASRNITP